MPIKQCVKDGKPGYTVGDAKWCITYEEGNEISRKKAKERVIKRWYAINPNEVKTELSKNKIYENLVENNDENRQQINEILESWPATIEDNLFILKCKEILTNQSNNCAP